MNSCVCSCLLHNRNRSLLPSMSVWLHVSDNLFVVIAIGFVSNSPHYTFGIVSNLYFQSQPKTHFHHWQSSGLMTEPQQPYVLYSYSAILFLVTRCGIDFKTINQCFHHIRMNSLFQQINQSQMSAEIGSPLKTRMGSPIANPSQSLHLFKSCCVQIHGKN